MELGDDEEAPQGPGFHETLHERSNQGATEEFLEVPHVRRRTSSTSSGAYRFTSLLQKIKRWQSIASALSQALETPAQIPREQHDDPLWVDQNLNKSWGEIRFHLENIVKASAGLLSVVSDKSGQMDYAALEGQVVKILKNLKPGIAAIKMAAVLDDTPGLGLSLVRRAKTMSKGIQRLLLAFDSPEVTSPRGINEVVSSIKELETPATQILKTAWKGEAEAYMLAQQEKERKAKSLEYSKEQAKRRIRKEREQKAKEEAELAALKDSERKEREKQRQIEAQERIRLAKLEAEQAYIQEAIAKNPRLRDKLLGEGRLDPADFDRSTDGFQHSEENVYDTGTNARAGFNVDSKAQWEKDKQAMKKKDAFIQRLKREQAQKEREERLANSKKEDPYSVAKKFSNSLDLNADGDQEIVYAGHTHAKVSSPVSPNIVDDDDDEEYEL
eukprot:m.73572 g.73572  ORF g.73572 m.73572 type:complete len:443 (-) comp12425_c0_seq1:3262-4590(-)